MIVWTHCNQCWAKKMKGEILEDVRRPENQSAPRMTMEQKEDVSELSEQTGSMDMDGHSYGSMNMGGKMALNEGELTVQAETDCDGRRGRTKFEGSGP